MMKRKTAEMAIMPPRHSRWRRPSGWLLRGFTGQCSHGPGPGSLVLGSALLCPSHPPEGLSAVHPHAASRPAARSLCLAIGLRSPKAARRSAGHWSVTQAIRTIVIGIWKTLSVRCLQASPGTSRIGTTRLKSGSEVESMYDLIVTSAANTQPESRIRLEDPLLSEKGEVMFRNLTDFVVWLRSQSRLPILCRLQIS